MKVAVVGSGLAGTVAALSARQAGAEVTVVSDRPGASALWSGVAEIFGPIYDVFGHQERVPGPHLRPVGMPPLEDAAARFVRMTRNRRFHPYERLEIDIEQVKALSHRALDLLDAGVVWPDGGPIYVANLYGVARLADATATSIHPGRLRRDRQYLVVGFEHYPRFSPKSAATALIELGIDATATVLDIEGAPLSHTPATASAALEALGDEALEQLAEEIGARSDGRVALLPPVLGRSLSVHRRLWAHLSSRPDGLPTAELAGVDRSLHGFRLYDWLGQVLASRQVTVRRGRASGFRRDGRSLVALELQDESDPIEADTFVLATGRAWAGGIRRQAPFAESLLELPLYLGGTPVDPVQQFPPDYLRGGLFEDHPLFTMGLGVSPGLQPLDADIDVAYDNLWASGLVLGGTNFTRDGSAFGVALVTGYLAGQAAASGRRTWD